MRQFLTFTLRNSLAWTFPLLVALDMAMLFGRSAEWPGVWSQTSVASQVGAPLVGMAVAAAAAHNAFRQTPESVAAQHLASPRPSYVRELLVFASGATWVLLAQVIAALVAMVTTLRYEPRGPGLLWLSIVVLGLLQMLFDVALGTLCAKVFRSLGLAIPAAVVLGFVAIYFHVTFTVLSVPSYAQVPTFVVAVDTVAVVAFIAGVVLAPSRRGQRRLSALPMAGMGVAVISLGFVAVAGATPLELRPVGRNLRCAGEEVTLCQWRDDAKYATAWESMRRRVELLPSSIRSQPIDLIEEANGGFPRRGRRVEIGFGTEMGTWNVAQVMAVAVETTTLPTTCFDDDVASDWLVGLQTYEYWLTRRIYGADRPAGYGGGPDVNHELLASVVKRRDAEQLKWGSDMMTELVARC